MCACNERSTEFSTSDPALTASEIKLIIHIDNETMIRLFLLAFAIILTSFLFSKLK